MVVNFRTRRISRGAHKLVRTLTLIIKKKKRFDLFIIYMFCPSQLPTKQVSYHEQRSPVRISQTSDSLETYIIINFKARGISQDTCKLARTLTLIIIIIIIIIIIDLLFVFLNYLQNKFYIMSRNPRHLSQFFIHHQC